MSRVACIIKNLNFFNAAQHLARAWEAFAMTMLLDECLKPSATTRFENGLADRPLEAAAMPQQYKRVEAQAAKTQRAFERLDHSELRVKTSATQILLAILRYAAAQDDPAG